MSLTGELKYPVDFRHFEYADLDAPKGGAVNLSAAGTFDTLNQFVIKGNPAAGLYRIYDSLMSPAGDEPSSEYGNLARSAEIPADLTWTAFNLRPEARWHDGRPLTSADVVFSFNLLKNEGVPSYRYYYKNVAEAVAEGPHRVRFNFSGPTNKELPHIIGQLVVLPRHYWQGREFNATTLDPPLGSGPYRVGKVKPGTSISYERVENYWGRELPVNLGRHNFGTVRYVYFRDRSIALEAFKAGDLDFFSENNSKRWATEYDFPALRQGRVIKEKLPRNLPVGMQAYVFNTRRAIFRDERVREALSSAFDFEWSNANLFYGQYTRTKSFFANSKFASRGLPDKDELALLEPLRGRVPDKVFTAAYEPPRNDRKGALRRNLRKASELLAAAGWQVRGGRLVNAAGMPLSFEILMANSSEERIAAPMVRNLERLGVRVDMRLVDRAQYERRVSEFDFDMITQSWGQSFSPGNEQRRFWGSEAAGLSGSSNYAGIKDPAVDILIGTVVFAKDARALTAATRALDRVLLWNHFVIPQFHITSYRIAYWDMFGRPALMPEYGLGFNEDTWWVDPGRARALGRGG